MEHEIKSLMEKGVMLLGYKNWSEADKNFDQVLELSSEHAPAYIGKLCVQLKVQHEENLANHTSPLEDLEHFQNALKFAEGEYREKVLYYNRSIYEACADDFERIARNNAIKERNAGFDEWRAMRIRWFYRYIAVGALVIASLYIVVTMWIEVLFGPGSVLFVPIAVVATIVVVGIDSFLFKKYSNHHKQLLLLQEQHRVSEDRNGEKIAKKDAIFKLYKVDSGVSRWQLECKCGNLYDDGLAYCNNCGLSTAESEGDV